MTGLLLSGIPELFLLSFAFLSGDSRRYLAILAAALIHEAGHTAAAAILGVKMRVCRTGIAGVSLRYDFSLSPPIKEIVVCLAGPIAGFCTLAVCYFFGQPSYFAGANAALSAFNLLPISFLDGGAVLSSALSLAVGPDTAWRICRAASEVFTLILWFAAVYILLKSGGDISVMAAAIYLMYRLFSEY